MNPVLSRRPGGGWILGNLAPWFIATLLGIPDTLAPEQPDAVRRRLYPSPRTEDDPEAREEWARLVHPELFALLASAREVVERDLGSLDIGEGPGQATLEIPEDHVQAWISALNAARLTLAETHEVDAEDMERTLPREDWDAEKSVAVARIDLMGWIQEMLVHAVAPPPRDAFEEPEPSDDDPFDETPEPPLT